MTKTDKGRKLLMLALAAVTVASASMANDPDSYAKMGSRLWTVLADRQVSGISAKLLPYYIFTDGEVLTIIPKAFVANYSVGAGNPLKVVLPGPATTEASDKYDLVPLGSFLSKNSDFVNMVTSRNPIRSNMLNIYASSSGTPTTVEGMSRD